LGRACASASSSIVMTTVGQLLVYLAEALEGVSGDFALVVSTLDHAHPHAGVRHLLRKGVGICLDRVHRHGVRPRVVPGKDPRDRADGGNPTLLRNDQRRKGLRYAIGTVHIDGHHQIEFLGSHFGE
jgi:hypothetical protein